MKIAIILTCILSLACLGSAKPRKDAPYISLSPTDTLHIQVADNLTMSNIGRNDRFRRISETIEEVLEEIDFPLHYEVTRFSNRQIPPGHPRLDIYIMKWGDNGMSQIEARFSASIRRNYDRNKLGVFTYRGGAPIGTNDQIIRVYNDVLRRALVELAADLNQRLASGISEGLGDGESIDEDDALRSE